MNLLVINILLGVGFMIAMETFSLGALCAGLAIGYGALWLTRPLYGNARYFKRVAAIARLGGFFLKALVVSNLRVLWDVVTPAQTSKPGIIGLPLDASSDFEIMLVANLVSLTPGTLSIDVSPDKKTLYVHVMFLDDVEESRRTIKKGLEKRVLEVLR